jgi:hypothetical protein
MAINDPILATQYNTTRSKIDAVLGAVQLNQGYGAALSSSSVKGPSAGTSPADTITDVQWDNLRTDITKAYKHQTGLTPTITDIYAGLSIQWAHALQYDTLSDTIITNKDTVYTGATVGSYVAQVDVLTSTSRTLTQSTWGTTSTTYARLSAFTVSWPTTAEARQFFNTGGYFKLSLTTSGTSTNTKTDNWISMISTINSHADNYVDYVRYRLAAGMGSGSLTISTSGSNPYSENYATLTITYVDDKTFTVALVLADLDQGDQQNGNLGGLPGVVVDEPITVNVIANVTYRVSKDQIVASIPTIPIPNWTISNTL